MARNRISLDRRAAAMREARPVAITELPPGVCIERHFTVGEIATMWNFSPDAIRKLFQDEPGVFVFGNSGSRNCRRYTTLRIPQSVMERVHRRMTKV